MGRPVRRTAFCGYRECWDLIHIASERHCANGTQHLGHLLLDHFPEPQLARCTSQAGRIDPSRPDGRNDKRGVSALLYSANLAYAVMKPRG